MESQSPNQQIMAKRNSKAENTEWKTIGVKVRVGELPLLNRQLARFNYNTLGDLVKGSWNQRARRLRIPAALP